MREQLTPLTGMLDFVNFPLFLGTVLLLINFAGGVLLTFLVQKINTSSPFDHIDKVRGGALISIVFVNFAMWATSILELKLLLMLLAVGILAGNGMTPLLFPAQSKSKNQS